MNESPRTEQLLSEILETQRAHLEEYKRVTSQSLDLQRQGVDTQSRHVRLYRTPRLALEPQVAAHAEEMFAVLCDPAIYEFENEPPASVEWLRQRFTKLETRRSADGSEHWLNWVIHLPSAGLIGYVQATVSASKNAAIAYEMASRFWGNGYASEAVRGMIGELVAHYGVVTLSAVLKSANHRSLRLLERLGFSPASDAHPLRAGIEAGELLMARTARSPVASAL